RLALRVVETETHILYRADSALVALSGVENARQAPIADLKVCHLAGVRAIKLRDLIPDARSFRQFYQQRPRQFVLAGKQLIVRVDLVLNGVVVDDALGADHLLNLEKYGVVIFKDESYHRTDR